MLTELTEDGWNEFYFLALALILAFGTLQTLGTVVGTPDPVVSVISCSMYPVYSVGDLVLVQGQNVSELEEGEIIVFDRSDQNVPIIHRVAEKGDNSVTTKGDNNQRIQDFEKGLTDEEVRGSALFSIPRVGALKLLVMDFVGLGGTNTFTNGQIMNRPISLENSYSCETRVPLDEREYD